MIMMEMRRKEGSRVFEREATMATKTRKVLGLCGFLWLDDDENDGKKQM